MTRRPRPCFGCVELENARKMKPMSLTAPLIFVRGNETLKKKLVSSLRNQELSNIRKT